jgi:hypothetical protein
MVSIEFVESAAKARMVFNLLVKADSFLKSLLLSSCHLLSLWPPSSSQHLMADMKKVV